MRKFILYACIVLLFQLMIDNVSAKRKKDQENYYTKLGVTQDAPVKEIKKAYLCRLCSIEASLM